MAGSRINRGLSLRERRFFALLRSGIWNTVPERDIFSGEVDWNEIYQLAAAQAVVGHVTDGINHLPSDLMPEAEDLDPFLGDMMGTEKRNHQLNSFIPFLFKALHDIPVVLIKGQGVALDYPEPNRRQPGDIDLLLQPYDYDAAKEILVPKATMVGKEMRPIYHQGLFYRSIEVEIHGSIQTLMSPSLDRALALLQNEMFASRDFSEVEIGGSIVQVPNAGFNAIYILVHFLHHYWSSGVGLRQLLDWTIFISSHKRDIDPILLEERLEKLGLKRIWQTFAGFVHEYLGCPSEKLPLWTDKYSSAYGHIWKYLLKSGNFGKNQPRERKDEPYLIRKIHSFFLQVVYDRLRHFPEFPRESIRYFAGAFRYGLGRLAQGE